MDSEAFLDEVTAGVLDCGEVEEVGGDEQGLDVLVVDGNHAVVGVVDELFEGGRFDAVDGDVVLAGFGQVVEEHGVEVGDAGGEDDAVGGEFGIAGDQGDVAELSQAADFFHFLEAVVGPVRVGELLGVVEDLDGSWVRVGEGETFEDW